MKCAVTPYLAFSNLGSGFELFDLASSCQPLAMNDGFTNQFSPANMSNQVTIIHTVICKHLGGRSINHFERQDLILHVTHRANIS